MESFFLGMWCVGDVALSCVLFRAWKRRLFAIYPYFYSYIASVVGADIVRHVLSIGFPSAYNVGWWATEFLTALAGLAITWEIFAQMLRPYSGAKRMARAVFQMILVLILFWAGAAMVAAPNLRHLVSTTAELQRDLRLVQTILIVGLVGLIVHYMIPIGRNLQFMILGYGSYLICQVVTLDLLARWGKAFETSWRALSGMEYDATVIIWCIGLWSLFPNPTPDRALEADYQRISQQTVRAFDRLRDHVVEPWRT